VLGALASPHSIQGHLFYITLSIGMSRYPEDGKSVDTMLQNVDVTMYHAKTSGRINFQFFKEEMNQRAVRRLFVINGLRRALKKQKIELAYELAALKVTVIKSDFINNSF
jgi:predicted signal transduction protein with EAL and GGDEF domain